MATAPDTYALSQAYQRQQNLTAAKVAALVALYYRYKVDVLDPASVDAWITLMLPRITSQSDQLARLAAAYATTLRALEVPEAPKLTISASAGSPAQAVKTSLLVVGPSDYLNKARQIEQLDVSPVSKQAMLAEAKQVTAAKVTAATVRHVASGGRQTIIDTAQNDQTALGYVRVTQPKPCFFCAMLASRGLVFADDSFDASDPRFIGPGDAKVHDSCGCTMAPVYVRKGNKALEQTQTYTDLWEEWGAGGGDALTRFRRGYEHYVATGEKLPYDVVDDITAYRARNSAA